MAAIATLANQQNIDDDDIYLGKFVFQLNFIILVWNWDTCGDYE